MTGELSPAVPNLRVAMSVRVEEERSLMNDMTCPWCEAELALRIVADEQTCPECGTAWVYEDEPEEELPLAA